MGKMGGWFVVGSLLAIAGTAATAAAQTRGVQFTPDGKRVLVNKDVGSERWAITRNENGTVTGNVFRSDGGDPAFVFCSPLEAPNAFACYGADACTDASGAERGIQTVPDDARVLAQKDVGSERWALSLNFDDGTATGNVFRADGGEPAFVVCDPTGTPNQFDCSGADKCLGTPCTQPFMPIGRVTLPASFFAVPDPCAESYTKIADVVLPSSFFEPAATVSFVVGASAAVQGFDLQITYSTALGTFVGAGEDVSCTTNAAGSFVKNGTAGRLLLIVGSAATLPVPITIDCGFSATGDVSASSFTVVVREVTQNGSPGDPSVLSVGVTVH
jgi:hypothetical protein